MPDGWREEKAYLTVSRKESQCCRRRSSSCWWLQTGWEILLRNPICLSLPWYIIWGMHAMFMKMTNSCVFNKMVSDRKILWCPSKWGVNHLKQWRNGEVVGKKRFMNYSQKLWPGTANSLATSAVVGMFFPYRHVGIIWSRRRHACRHNSSFKIEWNTRRKTVKTIVSRIIHAYILSLPSYIFIKALNLL